MTPLPSVTLEVVWSVSAYGCPSVILEPSVPGAVGVSDQLKSLRRVLHATVYAHARRRQPAHGSRQPRALHAHGQADAHGHGDGPRRERGGCGVGYADGCGLGYNFCGCGGNCDCEGRRGCHVSTKGRRGF
ncbi:uncharacterized protein K441DRAFT_700412 [Cenococcum geophilum 1.58]|uniref:uncharacterized protein n=1 Tax=Cenococcum geophilum 1.58 TaxID=794803 RepID=UPI00358E2CCF|nr:hypothetical protein K441DRAFT_700412 [Cenococcum geophilum 1.58]